MGEVTFQLKFDRKFLDSYRKKVDVTQQKIIDKKIQGLEKDPKKGKPLFRVYPHLYELYAGSYRIYYIVQHKEIRVVLLAYEHKDNQKKFLNSINKTLISRILEEIV